MAKTFKRIKGKIARIVDSGTVVINLGSEQGVDDQSIFYILGEPEDIIDPDSKEVLGSVDVTKSRVKASQVFERFTIATTSWTETTYSPLLLGVVPGMIGGGPSYKEIDEGDLSVATSDVQPWKARTASPVRVGDPVEVSVQVDAEEAAESEGPTGKAAIEE